MRQADQLPRGGLPHRPFERIEQCRIGLRVMEQLPGRVERGNPPVGSRNRTGPSIG
jgi:hypothetical protein